MYLFFKRWDSFQVSVDTVKHDPVTMCQLSDVAQYAMKVRSEIHTYTYPYKEFLIPTRASNKLTTAPFGV